MDECLESECQFFSERVDNNCQKEINLYDCGEDPLIAKKESVADVPLQCGVIPARVEERLEAYHILFEDGGMYLQRKEITIATDNPLSFQEIVIIKLCETILGKQA